MTARLEKGSDVYIIKTNLSNLLRASKKPPLDHKLRSRRCFEKVNFDFSFAATKKWILLETEKKFSGLKIHEDKLLPFLPIRPVLPVLPQLRCFSCCRCCHCCHNYVAVVAAVATSADNAANTVGAFQVTQFQASRYQVLSIVHIIGQPCVDYSNSLNSQLFFHWQAYKVK